MIQTRSIAWPSKAHITRSRRPRTQARAWYSQAAWPRWASAEVPGSLWTQSSWATEELTVPYYLAKQASERAAVAAADARGVELVRVLPTLVLGPGDHRITPSSRMLVDMLLGTGATAEGGANIIDVRDAADAIVTAGERGRAGARYILGGENLLIRDLGAIVTAITGRPVRHLGLPRWAMLGAAGVAELGAAITGKTPPITRAAVRDVVGRYAWYDVTRARTELGLSGRPAKRDPTRRGGILSGDWCRTSRRREGRRCRLRGAGVMASRVLLAPAALLYVTLVQLERHPRVGRWLGAFLLVAAAGAIALALG